jgi:hypothetical protein
MTSLWYYANNDQQIGPLTFAELQAALSVMSEPHKALVWHTGLDSWREAQQVHELSTIVPQSANPGTEIKPKQRPQRTWGGILTTVVVVGGLAAIRHLPSTEPALSGPITGKTREGFIREGHSSCLKKQEGDASARSLSLSREILSGYCSCYINALADLTTYDDVKIAAKDSAIPSIMKQKIDKVEPTCLDKFQRKLMGDQQ